MEDTPMDEGTIALETPTDGVFVPPSIHKSSTLSGDSYTHFSPVPASLLPSTTTDSNSNSNSNSNNDSSSSSSSSSPKGVPCVLGVDEAGRGPVLGPMVYGVFYLPTTLSDSLLKETHHFDDSKVLTPAVRSDLMRTLCTAATDLATSCGWAVSCLSARDIGARMQRPATSAPYNLNAQALDATIDLIRGVFDRGVHVTHIYVDTVGPPATHQAKLARVFPSVNITVAKKADSLYPCVSAASVCAKVTRDAALEVLYEARAEADLDSEATPTPAEPGWGSGYPSDARCVTWLRRNMHPVFGWGPECRFSWGTAKDMLETKGGVKVEWPVDEDDENTRLTTYFNATDKEKDADELGSWFGAPADLEAF